MPVFNIFSSSVKYKHKTSLCSFSTLAVLIITKLMLSIPFVIIYLTGGFQSQSGLHVETPEVMFKQKYLLLAERQFDDAPIVCSTFMFYKDNPISDDCSLIKVREVDRNRNGQKDALKFEARFYSDSPVRSIKLLLFFNYQIKKVKKMTFEVMTVFDYNLIHDIQRLNFVGDLQLFQRSVLHEENTGNLYNGNVNLTDQSLSELFSEDANAKITANVINLRVTWQTGFSSKEEVILQGEVLYSEELIRYKRGIFEELKWIWIQYLSVLLVFVYLTDRVLEFMFTKRYINSYVVVPWKIK